MTTAELKVTVENLLSLALSPPVFSGVVLFAIAFWFPVEVIGLDLTRVFVLGLVFVTILPIIPVGVFVLLRKTDWNVSNLKERRKFFVPAVLSYGVAAYLFVVAGSKVFFLLSLAYAAVTLAIAFISLTWKVSAHSAGVAGPITALVFMYGLRLLPLHVLTGLIIFARVKLRAHSLAQAVVGAAVGIVLTALIFFYIGGYSPPLF